MIFRVLAFWLALIGMCGAADKLFQSKEFNFQARFHRPVKVYKPRPGQVTFGYPPRGDKAWEAVSVLFGPLHKSRFETLKYLNTQNALPVQAYEVTKLSQWGYEGLQISGLDDQGRPYSVRIYTTPKQTYVVTATSMNTAHIREFFDTFRIGLTSPEASTAPLILAPVEEGPIRPCFRPNEERHPLSRMPFLRCLAASTPAPGP